MRKTADEYAKLIREKIGFSPKIGIVLGSGLGDLGEKIENPVFVDYNTLEGVAGLSVAELAEDDLCEASVLVSRGESAVASGLPV